MSHQNTGPHNYVHKAFHDQMLEKQERDFFSALTRVLKHGTDPERVAAIVEDVRSELHPTVGGAPHK